MRQLCDLVAGYETMSEPQSIYDLLAAAGWMEERKVDVEPQLAALRANGFSVWPEVTPFLEEFSGIVLSFVRNDRLDTAWVDPVRATSWADRPSVEAYEDRLGVKLVPVGYANHDHLLLMASDGGRFFGGYDAFLADLGASPVGMFEALMRGEVKAIAND